MSILRGLIGLAAALALLVAAFGLFVGLFGAQTAEADLAAHFRPHFALLALGAAFLAAFSGDGRTVLTALVVAGGGAFLMGPAWSAAERPAAASACGTREISVATANVLYVNEKNPAAIAALLAADADILATQETSAAFWDAPEADALRARYPHRVARLRSLTPTYNVVLWSRFPLKDGVENNLSPDAPMRAQAVADLGGGLEIGVAGLHFSLPKPIHQEQRSQAEGLGALLTDLPARRVLLGDFNGAPWSAHMDIVQRESGTALIGGLRRTWLGAYPNPFARDPIPAVLGNQIDHVLLSPGIGVQGIETFEIPGSDHFGVRAVIAVPERC